MVSFYIKHDFEAFIKLVERLQGVYVGFSVLDFANGLPLHDAVNEAPLEIVMDNGSVDKLIMFFTDKDGADVVVSFHNEAPTVWETETVCTHIITIRDNKVTSLQGLHTTNKLQIGANHEVMIYATAHTSVFPFILS